MTKVWPIRTSNCLGHPDVFRDEPVSKLFNNFQLQAFSGTAQMRDDLSTGLRALNR